MTAILYAIADCEPGAVPPRTSTGRTLRAVGLARPVAILGAKEDPQRAGRAAVHEHEQTVRELMAKHVLLPARYGTRVSPEAAAALLSVRRRELLAGLERVRDAVEIAVTVHLPPAAEAERPDPGPARPGTTYLQRQLAHERQREQVRRVLAPLGALSRACADAPTVHAAHTPPGVVRLAYLVARASLPAFVEALAEVDRRHPDLDVLATGPWPPYSFSGGLR